MNPLEEELPLPVLLPLEEGLVLPLEEEGLPVKEWLPSLVSVEELLLVALFVELPASIVITFMNHIIMIIYYNNVIIIVAIFELLWFIVGE